MNLITDRRPRKGRGREPTNRNQGPLQATGKKGARPGKDCSQPGTTYIVYQVWRGRFLIRHEIMGLGGGGGGRTTVVAFGLL